MSTTTSRLFDICYSAFFNVYRLFNTKRLRITLMACCFPAGMAIAAEQQCDAVWEKARNFADTSGQESREYVYAKQMCSEKGRSRTNGESASLGASYAGYGLSFGSGATSTEQFIEKACEFVNAAEKTGRINISKLNQLASDAGESYRACLNLSAKSLQARIGISDVNAQQVLIGLVYNGGGETSLAGLSSRNYDCFVEPRDGLKARTAAPNIKFPLAISGGRKESLNVVCNRKGNKIDITGAEFWPDGSIGLSILGDPVVFSYSAVTNLPPRDAATLVSRVNGIEKLLVPLGSIIDFYRPDLSTAIPPSFQLCDGSKIIDPYSLFAGKNTPNLIDRFAMGVPLSRVGETGGRADIPPEGEHSHGGLTNGFAGYLPGEVNYEVLRGRGSDFHMRERIGADGQHNHGGENRPPYIGVLKIMRIR